MSLVEVIPWMEIFLSLVFLGLIALGFWQGLLRELWFLLSLYLGSVLASLYGDYVGLYVSQAVRPQAGMEAGARTIASAWGFVVVLVVATATLAAVLYSLLGQLRLRASLLALDKLGGIVLGLLTALLITSLVAFLLHAVLSSPAVPGEWVFLSVLRKQRDWPIISLFRSTHPVIMAILLPWLPGGGPAFLQTLP